MEKKVSFTNEELTKKFKKSHFELVNYAIKLAENMIKTGRDSRVKSDVQNRAMLILEEINQGKDQFDDIKDIPPRTPQNSFANEFQQKLQYEESQERRKYRSSGNRDKE